MERDKARDRDKERDGERLKQVRRRRGSRDSEAGREMEIKTNESILTFCAKTPYMGETKADPE